MTIINAATHDEGQIDTEANPQTKTSIATPRLPSEAERRQLTVMFCDLVGSTELSQRLDPEDLREINRAYQDACKVAIERYEGYVAKYMGDGVLAYFGYPQAHEDDAERAIHAGLGVVESVADLNDTVGDKQGIELGVRVGIATGPVVVGDLIGEGASQESAVVGETPNLAARLQALATPNTVVVSPGTHELDAALQHFERSIALYHPEEDHALWQKYGETPPLMAMVWRCWVLWLRGFPEQALSKSHEAVEATQRDSDIFSAAAGLWFRTLICHCRGDVEAAREMAKTTVDFSTERGVQPLRILGTVLRGRAMLEDGRAEEGAALINSGVAEWRAEEIGLFLPWALSCLAEGHERCGNLEDGLKVINDAFEEAERSNDSFWLAELHRLQGTFLLTLSVKNGAEAETCFHKAIDVAQEQGARSLELRAATSLAQLWRGQGKRDEALDLLAPICDWFTEGFNTPDLIRAKKLLEQLA